MRKRNSDLVKGAQPLERVSMEEILAFRIINKLKKKGLIGDYAIAGGVAYIYYDEPIIKKYRLNEKWRDYKKRGKR
jgi:hypothetical protein